MYKRQDSHYAQPYITNVEYLEASVTQAIYDREEDALIVTLVPGPVASTSTSFTVHQLDRNKSYKLIKDGQVLGEVNAQMGLAIPDTQWQADGSLVISTGLAQSQSFILKATAATLAAR